MIELQKTSLKKTLFKNMVCYFHILRVMVNPTEFDYFAALAIMLLIRQTQRVYDVDVYEGNKKIAVVGFTDRQRRSIVLTV